MERRRRNRILAEIRCFVTTQKIPNTKLVARAVDVSKDGMRFCLDADTAAWQPFGEGDSVDVELVLPADHDFGERCIHGRGNVVRVEQVEDGEGLVALAFSKLHIRGLESGSLLASMASASSLKM